MLIFLGRCISTDINCRFKVDMWASMITSLFGMHRYPRISLNNAATLRFKIYDILKQQTNLSRSISETQMSRCRYNTLGSYFAGALCISFQYVEAPDVAVQVGQRW